MSPVRPDAPVYAWIRCPTKLYGSRSCVAMAVRMSIDDVYRVLVHYTYA
jgi:hypothetical protein